MFIPGSHVNHDRVLTDSFDAFKKLQTDLIQAPLPHCLYTHLQQEASDTIFQSFQQRKRHQFETHRQSIGISDAPNVDMVLHALLENPLQWLPLLNLAYYTDEQKEALRDACHVIQSYCDNEQLCYITRVYSGFPGSGKTTVAKHATYYAASQGLNIIVTTMANERSQLLGGQHIRDVFCMPVSKYTHVAAMVANSLDKLHKNPTKLIFLQQLDFINFDKIGLISACYVATMDAILQHVKSNNNPFVGVIVVANGDSNQCPPPSGESLWTSSSMLTDIHLFHFKQCIRMYSNDDREFLSLITKPDISDVNMKIIKETIKSNCHFMIMKTECRGSCKSV